MKKLTRLRPALGNLPQGMLLFFVLIALVSIGNGFSDSIYGNYFREAYGMDEFWRSVTEWPRELPGMICLLVIAGLAGLGDLRIALVAQVLAFVGLTVLGLSTPPMLVMYVFLFINSLGMHMFFPLQDAIGMSLAEEGQVGRRMGQYASVRALVGFACAIVVYFGFRSGAFSYTTQVKPVFLLGSLGFLGAVLVAQLLIRRLKGQQLARVPGPKLLLRREYKYYYLLTVMQGVQKQIAYVFGTWVLLQILAQKQPYMSLLYIIVNLVCIFFMRLLGHWMDTFGIKRMLYVDALSFIGVYIVYGFAVLFLTTGWIPMDKGLILISVLFVLDRMSMQCGIVKTVYLRSIARSDNDVTRALSTGTSLDHVVAIAVSVPCGLIWKFLGPHWVFFLAALCSLVNVYVAWRVKPEEEAAEATRVRAL